MNKGELLAVIVVITGSTTTRHISPVAGPIFPVVAALISLVVADFLLLKIGLLVNLALWPPIGPYLRLRGLWRGRRSIAKVYQIS